MAIYRMLKAVGRLMPGDVVLSDRRCHWGLMRLATPTCPHWFVNPLANEKVFYGPFLFEPQQKDWVGNGIAVEMTTYGLLPYRPHFTKRMRAFY